MTSSNTDILEIAHDMSNVAATITATLTKIGEHPEYYSPEMLQSYYRTVNKVIDQQSKMIAMLVEDQMTISDRIEKIVATYEK